MTNPRARRYTCRQPLVPDRIRTTVGQGFSFVPNRFLGDGFFASLQPDELRLYLLLVLASDRNGVSFYHYDSLCSLLRMPVERYVEARNALIACDLIAFDGTRFQVLSLPSSPPATPRLLRTADDMEAHDPATIRCLLADSHDER